jgi:cytochrome oxidase Cu insertion factor (SCO1/SenC/PrrC family)
VIERMWRRARRWAWGAVVVALAGFLFERVSVHVGSRATLVPSTAVGFTSSAANTDVNVDPRTALGGTPAPNFRLTDQFGRKIALANFRGKVVLLAFLDSRCTSICPLTTEEMVEARKLLGGAAAREVALVAVNANAVYTGVPSVYACSKAHGVLHDWYFLNGSLPALKKVWQAYGLAYGLSVAILEGAIDHTPAVYLIGPRGEEIRVYMTQTCVHDANGLRGHWATSAGVCECHSPGPPHSYGWVRAYLGEGVGAGPGGIAAGAGDAAHRIHFHRCRFAGPRR